MPFNRSYWIPISQVPTKRPEVNMKPLNTVCILIFVCIVIGNFMVLLTSKTNPERNPRSIKPEHFREVKTNSTKLDTLKVNQSRIQELCKQKQLYLRQNTFRQNFESWVLVHPKFKIAYCHLAKVGSTAWKTYLINLVSNNQTKQKLLKMDTDELHIAINALFSTKNINTNHEELSKYLQSQKYFTFAFVRHPFDRLVSAYIDKVLDTKNTFYRHVSQTLLQNYGAITFENFLRFVLKSMENCNSQTTKCLNVIDVHWQPYYQRCEFCDMKYDYIGRLETFNQDVKEVLIRGNLTEYIPLEDIKQIHQSTSMQKSKLKIDPDGNWNSSFRIY